MHLQVRSATCCQGPLPNPTATGRAAEASAFGVSGSLCTQPNCSTTCDVSDIKYAAGVQ
jgi:hypothetical protein